MGNDHGETSKLSQSADFNPRSLVGNDETTTKGAGYMFISIHVPSWGTTEEAIDIDDDEEISIHVPSWGTTVPGKTVQLVYDQFQSTFPRGERPIPYVASVTNIEFQSTFPRGERPRRISLSGSIYRISIHVPSWGTTMVFALLVYVSAISIHVPSWGTTVFLRKLTI